MDSTRRILLIGYGNPGRLDDGLGPALAAAVEKLAPAGVTVDSDYQLTVEDASDVAAHDIVIFADASTSGTEPYYVEAVEAKAALSFSSHSVEPAVLLHLAQTLFEAKTRGYILGIRGYEFNEFGEGLSEPAAQNLEKALQFIKLVLADPQLLDSTSRMPH
ncbi:MAG: hydrogenase maturation protease [Bacteroidota bacterium]|nr:hydrogenase maturation protease [Bacteroidota bacterium]